MFEHFLITRFNLQSFHRFVPDTETWVEWTRKRFPLFQAFCLPSVVNQTNKNFKWLIYFDAATPPEFDTYLNELRQYDFIDVCHAAGFEDFRTKHISDIRQKISPETKWVITSRLDNDDCLHKDAIDRIQKEFAPADKFIISLARGYVYDIDSQKLSQYYYLKGPFVSIVEKPDSMQACYYKNHNKWEGMQTSITKELYKRAFMRHDLPKAKFVLDDTLWMQVCHGKNLGNSFYRGFPVPRPRELNDFGLDKTSKPSRYIDVLKYVDAKIWWRQLLAAIFKKVYRARNH